MATRIYRPDAGHSWREAAATSSNETISTMLATFATDVNNRRLKRAMGKAERDMTLISQRTEAWGKAYERVGGAVTTQSRNLNANITSANNRIAELARLNGRMQTLNKAYESMQHASPTHQVSEAYRNAYLAEFNPLKARFDSIKPVSDAQIKANQAQQNILNANNRRLQGLQQTYERAAKRQKMAVKAYKSSVSRYNRDFYPV